MSKSRLDALKAVYQWVTRTMMKNQTGVMQTLPNRDLIELNTQITAQRLMQAGVDPTTLKNANQVENAVNIIESRPVQEGIKSTKPGKLLDMEGQEIPQGSKIMGGKAVKETEAEILARMKRENKEAAQRIRDKKKLEDRALEDFVDDAGGVDPNDPRGIDDFIPDPEDMATGGRAGFANGSEDSGAPSIRLEPRVSGIQTEQTVAPGITESVRDIDYGLTALLKGDKFYGGASLDKGKVKVDVETEEGKTLFKDSIGKDDAINFIVGMGQRDEGNKFEIKVDDDFENMNITFKKTFAEGGRIGLKDGPDMPGRRQFMKIMGGIASLPVLGKFIKPAMPLIQKGAEITGPALDKIVQTVMSAGKLISQSGRRVKEMVTKKKLKDVEVEEDIMDGPSYTIKTRDKTIYYKPGRQDEMGIEDDIIEVIEDTVTKKAGGGIARMLGE
jgi:hypothetical protein|tara:strand:- start:1619 stop:2950 length:1332 start_codon:yes stop_codon:yes gene_type:complete